MPTLGRPYFGHYLVVLRCKAEKTRKVRPYNKRLEKIWRNRALLHYILLDVSLASSRRQWLRCSRPELHE